MFGRRWCKPSISKKVALLVGVLDPVNQCSYIRVSGKQAFEFEWIATINIIPELCVENTVISVKCHSWSNSNSLFEFDLVPLGNMSCTCITMRIDTQVIMSATFMPDVKRKRDSMHLR